MGLTIKAIVAQREDRDGVATRVSTYDAHASMRAGGWQSRYTYNTGSRTEDDVRNRVRVRRRNA